MFGLNCDELLLKFIKLNEATVVIKMLVALLEILKEKQFNVGCVA